MKKPSLILLGLILLLGVSLACSTGSLGGLLASPTPPPTPTPAPTLTSTAAPTIPFAPESQTSGTSKTNQADGSVLFTDHEHQYSIVFPQPWTAISLNAEDISQMIQSLSGTNPDFEQLLTMLQGMDPQTFRIFAFDFRPEHLVEGYTSNINILVQENSLLSGMTLQNIVDVTVQSLPQLYSGITILSSNVVTSNSGIQLGVIEDNMPMTTATGTQVTVYQQMIIVQRPEGIVQITLSAHKSLEAALVAEFQSIIATFKILDQ